MLVTSIIRPVPEHRKALEISIFDARKLNAIFLFNYFNVPPFK